MMISNQISFVLPITLRENISSLSSRHQSDHVAAERFRLLLKSFLKYFLMNDLCEFLIICPKRDAEKIHLVISELTNDSRFCIITEDKLCPELFQFSHSMPGWYIQQILKLKAANRVHTDYYVTLDSDIICKRSMTFESFVRTNIFGHRAAYTNIEKEADYNDLFVAEEAKKIMRRKRRRFKKCAELLRREDYKFERKYSYGETPVVLHRESVLKMLLELEYIHDDWISALSNKLGWTEYSLYFTYLEKHRLFKKYHVKTGRSHILDLDRSVWKYPNWYRKHVVFTPEFVLARPKNGGYFIAIQSYLNESEWLPENASDIGDFYRRLNQHFDNMD